MNIFDIKLKEYVEGTELKEDEYLLKIRKDGGWNSDIPTGFLTKLNKDKTIPKAFAEWGAYPYARPIIPPIKETYVWREIFSTGWKLETWRFGKSQNWAVLIHPNEFTLEIYLSDLLKIIKENELKNGEIIGKFKWKDNILIKES